MEVTTRITVAETLRQAAEGTIPEEEFWRRFQDWSNSLNDPRIMLAWEQAEHYWSNFHRRNIFFIPVKPDKDQLDQGKEALLLLAKAFEEDWSQGRIEKELHLI